MTTFWTGKTHAFGLEVDGVLWPSAARPVLFRHWEDALVNAERAGITRVVMVFPPKAEIVDPTLDASGRFAVEPDGFDVQEGF